jgi:hypothetical protein
VGVCSNLDEWPLIPIRLDAQLPATNPLGERPPKTSDPIEPILAWQPTTRRAVTNLCNPEEPEGTSRVKPFPLRSGPVEPRPSVAGDHTADGCPDFRRARGKNGVTLMKRPPSSNA